MKSARFAFAATVLLATVCIDAGAAEPTLGQREFRARCAMCHGTEARGDGWMAANLIQRPPSLRGLKKKNGGTFPQIGRAHV